MDREVLTTHLFYRAAFPVMKVLLHDDPSVRKAFDGVTATVLFEATSPDGEVLPCTIRIADGDLSVTEAPCTDADLTFRFSSTAHLNTLLRGGLAMPRIGGWYRLGMVTKFMRLLLGLKLMAPSARPTGPVKRYLKVKMSLYMITTALSVYNKLDTPEMTAWTAPQPDRIYQFVVEPYEEERGIAAYLRVKAGRTKAGRGVYRRRSPFVHFRFSGVDGALAVLLKDLAFVESVEAGAVQVDGSPEYAQQLNDLMATLQGMMT